MMKNVILKKAAGAAARACQLRRAFLLRVCFGFMLLLLALFFLSPAPASGDDSLNSTPEHGTARPVIIDYYFEQGCEDCRRVNDIVLPALEAGYSGFYELNRLDLGIETNYLRLVRVMDRLGSGRNEHVFISLDNSILLEGYPEIAARLLDAMSERLSIIENERARDDELLGGTADQARELIAARAGAFTLAGVIAAGLIDGINPCAMSTLVFFVSLLSVSRIRGRMLLIAGAAFCLACFLTYFAIGFGLLMALHLFWLFPTIRTALNLLMVLALLVLAAFSFRDAVRYQASGDPSDIALQIPDAWKRRVHALMRDRMRSGHIALAGFSIGAAVTAVESVCTGQVYVPTLVFIVKSGADAWRGILYLLLYNFLFVLPLVIIFIVTYQGLKFQKLLDWSRRNVIGSKILLGVFFLMMAGLILVL